MTRNAFFLVCGWMGVVALAARPSAAHSGHDPSDHRGHARASEQIGSGARVERLIALAADQRSGSARSTAVSAPLISGQGDLRFKVLHGAELLPAEAMAVLVKAHGGFAVDRRPGRGEVYFALPGAGIIRLSGDLTEAIVLRTPNAMRDASLHDTTLWLGADATPYLTFPSVSSPHVFTTTLEGRLLDTLNAPGSNHDFGNATVNEYFAGGGKFVPTDVEKLGDLFYITTGYSALDYVLTAKVASAGSVSTEWHDLVFGGRGDGPGQFGTGHAITLSPRRTQIVIADRPNAKVERFTPEGRLTGTLHLPEGSWPVNVDFQSGYMVVGSLYEPDRSKAAPIYILKDDRIVSTVRPKDELGLENFQHVHNAVMVEITGKLYLIAQAWNPGDFAVLEQVTE